jgi:hypothetical protein
MAQSTAELGCSDMARMAVLCSRGMWIGNTGLNAISNTSLKGPSNALFLLSESTSYEPQDFHSHIISFFGEVLEYIFKFGHFPSVIAQRAFQLSPQPELKRMVPDKATGNGDRTQDSLMKNTDLDTNGRSM